MPAGYMRPAKHLNVGHELWLKLATYVANSSTFYIQIFRTNIVLAAFL